MKGGAENNSVLRHLELPFPGLLLGSLTVLYLLAILHFGVKIILILAEGMGRGGQNYLILTCTYWIAYSRIVTIICVNWGWGEVTPQIFWKHLQKLKNYTRGRIFSTVLLLIRPPPPPSKVAIYAYGLCIRHQNSSFVLLQNCKRQTRAQGGGVWILVPPLTFVDM